MERAGRDRMGSFGMRMTIFAFSVIFLVAGTAVFGGVELRKEKGAVAVLIAGEEFTRYNYAETEFPHFYPLREPDGANVTRHWPMEEIGEGESHDHPHHKSLWFAHGSVNGVDFWHRKGRIVQTKIAALDSGEDIGLLKTENEWRKSNGDVVCTDTRRHIFTGDENFRAIDIRIELKALHGDVVFGDTKEGTMALRVAPSLRLKGEIAKGHILMSTGRKDGKAWGTRAAWCDYYGPLNGETVGVAIFDSPKNLRHPTWWHARDYGLLTANPFGISHFEKKPRGAGDFKLEKGETFVLRYGVFIHKGEMPLEKIQKKYEEWTEKSDI